MLREQTVYNDPHTTRLERTEMKRIKQVASYKNAQRLYQLGLILETYFVWVEYESLVSFDNAEHHGSYKRTRYTHLLDEYEYDILKKQGGVTILHTYPAPTVAELGEALPPCTVSQREENGLWGAIASHKYPSVERVLDQESEADARCELLIAITKHEEKTVGI